MIEHKLTDFNRHQGVQERFAFDPASNRVPLPYATLQGQTGQGIDSHGLDEQGLNGQGIDGRTKRPTALITQGKKVSYVYDRHGRVQFKTIVPVDKEGNALKQSSQSIVGYLESLQLFYNTNNALEKSANIQQQGFEVTITTTLYYYDAFGRRIGKSSEVQKASKLNQQGRLVRFPDSLINLRRSEKSQRQSMLMLWDGNRQIQEYTKDHVFTTVYEQASFVPVARIVELSADLEQQRVDKAVAHVRKYVPSGIITQDVLDNIEKAKQPLVKIYYYHCNHLGTPQELSNQEGDIVWLSYDRAWGECYDKFYKSQAIDSYEILAEQLQPFKFQGQMLDTETGLHYNRFRYYDSDMGMFIQRDPIQLLGGTNTFQYAPNPIEWIDPFGLAKQKKNVPGECKCEEVDPCKQPVDIKSGTQFGHTFTEHGSQRATALIDRARSTGKPQGYWINNVEAGEFLGSYRSIKTTITVPIPKGLGKVILPDGTVKEATHATIVPMNRPNKCLRTAYPKIGE